jgi:hypothetical protein
VEETKTTVMLPSVNGGLAPAMKVEELRTLGRTTRLNLKKPRCFPMAQEIGKWTRYDKPPPGKKAKTAAPTSGSPVRTLTVS